MDLRSIGVRPYGWAGIIAVIIMVVSVCFCVLCDTNWEYNGPHSSMCDFGVSDFWYVSVAFIGACITSGILFMVSGFGWFLFDESKYIRYGGLVVMFAGVALMCVGIFDKTYDFHQYVSIIFAVIFIIAIALVSVQDIIDRQWPLLIGLAVLGLYGLFTCFFYIPPFTTYTVVQVVLMGYVFFWFVMKSLRFMKKYHSGTVS
jgi:hypothetical membrane protein